MSTDATKKLITDLNVDLLGRLSKAVVKDNMFQEKRTDEAKPLKKKDVVSGIIKEIEKTGVKYLSDSLKVADAQAICETLDIDFKESNKGSKNVISKRLRARVTVDGLQETLNKLEDDQHTAILEALEVAAPKSSTDKATFIAGAVRRVGAEIVLSRMDMAFLKDLGEEQGLDVFDIASQTAVIDAILTGKVVAKEKKPVPKPEKISKNKPKLESGISIADMMQHYNLSELQDFARDNGLVISGKKKEVMKRISDFFENEEAPAAKKVKVVKKEEKKEEKKEKKDDKKEKETKKGKKAEEKKEEETEEVEAPKSPKGKGKKAGKKDEEKVEEKAEETEEKEAPKSPKGKGKKAGKKSEGKEVGER